jgi:hypothetical protein
MYEEKRNPLCVDKMIKIKEKEMDEHGFCLHPKGSRIQYGFESRIDRNIITYKCDRCGLIFKVEEKS